MTGATGLLWLATAAGHGGGDIGITGAIRGALVVIFAVGLFCGSIYYLLSTNVGARLSFLVCSAILSGFMALLALIWATTATPLTVPHGQQSHWKVLEIVAGPQPPSVPALRDGGGRAVDEAGAAEIKAVVDEALTNASSEFARFTSPSEYVVSDSRTAGGGKAGLFKHKPLHGVAVVQPAKKVEVEPGQPPPAPEADPSKAPVTVVLERDLGSLRVPAYLTVLASLIFFALSLAALSSTEKAMAAAAAPAGT